MNEGGRVGERNRRRSAPVQEIATRYWKEGDGRDEEAVGVIADAFAAEEAKNGSTSRLPYSSPIGLALYLALVDHVALRPGKPLPSVAELGVLGWTGDIDRDRTALRDLYDVHLLAVAPETPQKAFDLSPEKDGLRFFAVEARWRLVGDAEAITAHASVVEGYFMAEVGQEGHEARQALSELVRHMEIVDVIVFLDELLTMKHGCPEVPEGRRRELDDVVRTGFDAGHTRGQMIGFAWRAADMAASKEGPYANADRSEASAGAVTILGNELDRATELSHPVSECEPPRWHRRPRALEVLRELHLGVRNGVFARCQTDVAPLYDHSPAGPLGSPSGRATPAEGDPDRAV